MKVLVHGGSLLGRSARLGIAACGLAARGHEVRWRGGDLPHGDGVTSLRTLRETHTWHPDVVIGAGPPARVAWLAWRVHAHAMLLEFSGDELARRSTLDSLAWHALPAYGIVDEAQADAVRAASAHVDLERVALWPAGEPAPQPEATHADTDVLERACERLLALRSGQSGRSAVFLDRDGTLIVEEGYLAEPERLQLLPGVPRALRQLRDAGFVLAVVSNQSGVGRGKFTLAEAYATMARLRVALREHGVELDAIRFCPHAPEDGCACRKPGTQLLEELAADLRLSLVASVMVGDKRLDAAAGRAAGGTGLLVRTGYGRAEESECTSALPEPDAVFDDLAAAVAWILERHDLR